MQTEGFLVDACCTDVLYAALGPIGTNVYVVDDGAGGAIVCDPAGHVEAIKDLLGGRPISALFVTHKHYDHVGALKQLRDESGAKVYATEVDAPEIESGSASVGHDFDACPVDVRLNDGDTLEVGNTTWQVITTPGHTPGSCCFYLDPARAPRPDGAPILLSGDTLFHATIGRTDLPGGNMDDMRVSLRKLGDLLDDSVVVFPGHNELTKIGMERWRVIDFLGNPDVSFPV